jgi:prepilin-type N-terminal cleavage/methylation domain-containing protein
MNPKEKKIRSGFTLIELLVVVAALGVLASVATPLFSQYQTKARKSEALFMISHITKLEEVWKLEYGAYGTCLNLMGFVDRAIAGPEYFSIGFSFPAKTPAFAAINSLSVVGGAPAECMQTGYWAPSDNLLTPAVSHWYEGNKGIGGRAPTLDEFILNSSLTTIDFTGQYYSLAAVGNVDNVSPIAFQKPLLMDYLVPSAMAQVVGNEWSMVSFLYVSVVGQIQELPKGSFLNPLEMQTALNQYLIDPQLNPFKNEFEQYKNGMTKQELLNLLNPKPQP